MNHPVVSFAQLSVPAPLVQVLTEAGKPNAFPIQIDTLPDTLAGRDVLGRGKTGSGKTLAFSIPLVARLAKAGAAPRAKVPSPRALVLVPTRELANQIDAVIAPLAAAYGLKSTTIFGGVSQKRQVDALRAGADIVVACPGRLEDLLQQRLLTLDAISVTVLDEADHMADLGFLPGVTRILSKIPTGGQRMLFSATLDNGVDKLVARFLKNEVLHSVDEANSHVEMMTHHIYQVEPNDKPDLIKALAGGLGRRILFTRTKHQAKKLAKRLSADGIPAVDLHGNLSQGQRDRNLLAFSEGGVKVLVATDVAARGVHVDSVELVVHIDPPTEHKSYLHRSGRTARAGSAGDVVTLVLPDQRRDAQVLLRKAEIKASPIKVHAKSEAVSQLVGDRAAWVKPAPAAAAQPQNKRRNSAPSRSPRNPGSGSGSGSGSGRVARESAPSARPSRNRSRNHRSAAARTS